MFARSFEILLVALILVGCVLVSQSMWKKADLQREHDRLMQKTGQLVITDPTKVHILALDTGEPLHFAWRAYFPANYNFAYSLNSGSSGWGTQSEPWEGILRVRMRMVDNSLLTYYRFKSGSGLGGIGSPGMRRLLEENPELLKEFRVEQLGMKGPITLEADKVHTLIKIDFPDDLLPIAKQKLNDWEYKRFTPTLQTIRIGPQAAIEKELNAGGSE